MLVVKKFLDEYKFFIKKMGLIGISNFLITITPVILLPILTQNLPIQDYVIWVQFQITITLIPAVAILGLPYTMVRFMSASKSKENIQEFFYSFMFTVMFASLIMALILFLLAGPISNAIFNGNIEIGLILPATAFMTALTLLFFDFFRAFNQMTKYAILTTLQAYLIVIIVTAFVLLGFGILGAIAGIFITQVLICIIMFILISKQIGFKIPQFKNLKEFLSFGLPTIPSNMSFWILDATDRYVIGLMLGVTAVSYYSAGYTISALMSLLTAPLYTVLLPILSGYHAEGRIKDTKFLLNYSIKLYLVIAIPAVIGLSFLSKPLLFILSTPELALNGFMITPILAIGGLFFGLYCIVTQILVLERKTRITGNIWIISTILNIVFDITFGYLFGIMGIAVTTLAIYLFAFLITVYYSFKYIRCNFYFGFITKTIYAGFFMAAVLLLLNPYGVINIVISSLVAFAVYMVSLWLFKGIRTYEIKFFIDVIKEIFTNTYKSITSLK
ncbi:MAG: oligosaccharide flippase family protein [Methanobacterium sp.]|nr:oligosaccharide flippase family protein [Methanobacterium sp.]